MKKEIQTLVAIQLLSLKDNISTYNYEKNQIREDKYLTVLEALKIAVSEGLDIMLPLNEDEITHGEKYSSGENGKITFIEKMMSNNSENKDIVHFLHEKITEDDIKKAHPQFMKNIYNVLNENGISMKRMFEMGFDFEQGKFDEENKALAGDLDFFECCLFYKPDFDFNYQYSDCTLKESVKDELDYLKGFSTNVDKHINLINFIDKAVLKQNIDKTVLKDKLEGKIHKVKDNKLKI